MQYKNHRIVIQAALIAAAAAVISAPQSTQATDVYWNAGTASYNNSANWSTNIALQSVGFIPGSADNAINDAGSNNVVQILNSDPNWSVNDFRAGNGVNTNGAYLQDGPTATVNGWFRMGIASGSTGYYTLNSGSLVAKLRLLLGEAGTGVMTINGGTVSVADTLHVAENGTGVLNINGGTLTKTGTGGSLAFSICDSASLTASGVVNQTAGIVNSASEFWIGNNKGAGSFYMSGGSWTNSNWFVVGRGGAKGYMSMSGGTITKSGGGSHFYIGESGGTSSMDFSGGTINDGQEFWVANGGPGTLNMSGTAALNVGSWFAVGRGAVGVVNLSSGSITKTGDNGSHLDIGANGGTSGTLNQTGGTVTSVLSDTYLGENGTGVWNMNGGTATVAKVFVPLNNSANGTLNLNGGLFQASSFVKTSTGTGKIVLNGGTLQATADSATFITGLTEVDVNTGGAIIDSASHTITIPQGLKNLGGGLTKLGNGNLTLSGSNTFAGASFVNAGTLNINATSTGAGDYTLADNTTLGVASVSATNSFPVGNLTVGSVSGSTINLNLGAFGNPTSAPIYGSGALTVNGTLTLNIVDTAPQLGQFALIHFSTLAGSGKIAIGALPTGVTASLVTNANSIDLNISTINVPQWAGLAGGTWDIGVTTNWVNAGTGLPTTFSQSSFVQFNDNAGSFTVTLVTNVSPGNIQFANVTNNYTINGTNKITGTTTLTKNGAGSVTINTTNDFTGAITINGGTLAVAKLANGGAASGLGASSSSATNVVINNATLAYTGPAGASSDRNVSLLSTASISAQSDFSLSGHFVVTNSNSSFVKTGPAALSLTGAGQNEFALNLNPGLQVAQGTLMLNGTSVAQTNHTVNDLWVGQTTTSGAALVLSNTTLLVDGWFALGRGNGNSGNLSTATLNNSRVESGNFSLGYANGLPNLASQVVTLNGSSTWTNHGDCNIGESGGSTSTLNINDNSVFFSQNRAMVVLAGSCTGYLNMANNGKMVVNSGWFSVANGGTASMVMKDSSSFVNAGDFNVTDSGNATGSALIQDNAQITANNFYVAKGANSIATLTITNNANLVSLNGMTIANNNSASGTVNLAGGSLAVNLLQGSGGTAIVNFNGGKIIARNPIAQNFMFSLNSINVLAGGAIIDSDTNNIAIAQPLLGDANGGGLTKMGNGTLRLNGANTYTGMTTVSAGTLAGTGTIAGSVTVGGATLTAGDNAIGTLTIKGSLALGANSKVVAKLSTASFDQFSGLSSVNYGGALVVTNNAGYGVFKLFSAPGTGSFSSITVYPAAIASFNYATGELTISQPNPTISSSTLLNGQLSLVGAGGTPNANYTVLTTTNVTDALSTWTTNTTGVFDSTGAYTKSIPVSSDEPTRFYKIQTQ